VASFAPSVCAASRRGSIAIPTLSMLVEGWLEGRQECIVAALGPASADSAKYKRRRICRAMKSRWVELRGRRWARPLGDAVAFQRNTSW